MLNVVAEVLFLLAFFLPPLAVLSGAILCFGLRRTLGPPSKMLRAA